MGLELAKKRTEGGRAQILRSEGYLVFEKTEKKKRDAILGQSGSLTPW